MSQVRFGHCLCAPRTSDKDEGGEKAVGIPPTGRKLHNSKESPLSSCDDQDLGSLSPHSMVALLSPSVTDCRPCNPGRLIRTDCASTNTVLSNLILAFPSPKTLKG